MAKILTNITIEKIWYGWIGLATLPDGKKIMVKGALPGSVVDVKIVKVKKDYIEAHIAEVKSLNKAFDQKNILCPHYQSPLWSASDLPIHKQGCGGCKRQILSYEQQLELKKQIIEDCFRTIPEIFSKAWTGEIIGSPQLFQYRNKIEFSFGKYLVTKSEPNVAEHRNLGFHKQWEFSKVLDIDQCYLISPKADIIFKKIKKLCQQSGLPVHDAKSHEGFFRHLVIREGIHTDQILVNLAVAEQNQGEIYLPQRSEFKKNLLNNEELKKEITTFVITYNNGLADIVNDPASTMEILWWEGYIYEQLQFTNDENLELNFRVSPFSFFQTNTLGAQQLFQHANQMLGESKGLLLDLYCGAWTIGLTFLKMNKADQVIGIEIVPDAITDAHHNARINALEKNCYFVAWKAEKLITTDEHLAKNSSKITTVIIDPPRDGLHPDVVTFLWKLKQTSDFKLLYISCNPVTMARDIKLLTTQHFKFQKLKAVDMFPHTHHIEMIGLLS